MVTHDSNVLRQYLIRRTALVVLLVLEGSTATLKPVNVVVRRDKTVSIVTSSLGQLILLVEGGAHRRAHLIVSEPLADIVIATECDIASDR